jgi:hypothetical protein
MFAADLSWQVGESVGQRKERKARERSSGTPSVRTSVTSRSSSSTDRQEWWTAGLNKIKAKSSSKSSVKGRPVTSPSSSSQQRYDPPPLRPVRETITRDFPTWELELPNHLKEPAPKPAYTFSKSLSPNLPSGGSMDILESDVPELEGDISSRYTHSIVSVSSRTYFQPGKALLQADLHAGDHHWEVRTPPADAMSGFDGVHAYDPYSLASIDTRTSFGSREQQESTAAPRADVVSREKRSGELSVPMRVQTDRP